MAKATEIKVGNILRYNGELVTVTEVLHRTPGKGGAFYLDKFRNIKTGKIVEARLATDEQVEAVAIDHLVGPRLALEFVVNGLAGQVVD